ncbi:MAG: endonuclease/exonuclease/phosphatase family protein [Cyanobacteriota bacterium]
MRLISWNVNARRTLVERQVTALAEFCPDIIALQEVTPTSLLPFQIALRKAGYLHIVDSFSLAPVEFIPLGPRRYGLLLASRYALAPQNPDLFQLPWPERVLSAAVQTPDGLVNIHNTHVPPGSSNGWVKVDHLIGLFDGLAHLHPNPCILCGDFNTPQAELSSGEVVTWGQRLKKDGSWRVARTIRGKAGAAWDEAERRVLIGLAEWGLQDVFRCVNGYEILDFSWFLNRKGDVIGRRFDHIYASTQLQPRTCEYIHGLRIQGLSDHSPIMADFAPQEKGT